MNTIKVPVWLPHGLPDGSYTSPVVAVREEPFTWAELHALFPEKHTRTDWQDLLGCNVDEERPDGDGLVHKGNPNGPTMHGAVPIQLYTRNDGFFSLWRDFKRVKGYALIWLDHLGRGKDMAEFSLRRDESSVFPKATSVRGLLIPQS